MHRGERLAEFEFHAQHLQLCPQRGELFLRGGTLRDPLVILRATQAPVAVVQSGENCLHTIIVTLENGIELMIVTARAADGEPEQPLAHGADHFIEFILPRRAHRFLIPSDLSGQICRPGNQKPQRRIRAGDVARQLIADKFVVRQIGIERVDDPIAVMPRVGALAVGFKSHRLRPANDIEPMLRPTLTIARRGQQRIDGFRKNHIRVARVPHKIGHRLWRRRQAGEIERHAPQQRGATGFGGKFQRFVFQFSANEKNDGVCTLRHLHTFHGFERPMRRRGR